MAMQTLQTPAQRIGKLKGDILARVLPREVLSLSEESKPCPPNTGGTVVYRRWWQPGSDYTTAMSTPTAGTNPFFPTSTTVDRNAAMASAYLSQEGMTPNSEVLVPQDITVTLNEYTVLFGYTKRTADLYEDDVPSAMKQMVGDRIALVRESVRFGVLKGCTNKFYGGTGTTRAGVNGKLTPTMMRKISRALKGQHADKVTEILEASPKYGTTAVEASFLVYIHTDLEADVRDFPKFTPVAEYGSMKPVSPYELGKWEEFRFIASPELMSVQDSGALIGSDGLVSSANTRNDVYQVIVCGKGAFGGVSLRGGRGAGITPHDISPDKIDKNDPTGQRGYIGASTYFASVLLNPMHIAVCEVGASKLV